MASPSSQSSFQRAKEYSSEEWEAIRDVFTRLYQSPQTPKLTLSKIQIIMSEHHGFDATLRQYKRKVKLWNLERNIKLDDSKFMVEKEKQRKQQGKKTKFTVNGREVTEAKFARIRRKLFKSTSPVNPYIYTPLNIRYFTPRDPPGTNGSNHTHQHQRRASQAQSFAHSTSIAAHNTHLVECFLCPTITYGQELSIMQSFAAHIRSMHSGYEVLRCLNGQEASLVPGAVRTTKQLPTNQVGYIHGIRTGTFDPVRLGRICHVEDQGGGGAVSRRPYLALTHNASCITLRPEAEQSEKVGGQSNNDLNLDVEDHQQQQAATWTTTPFALNNSIFQDDINAYFADQLMTINQEEDYTQFDDDYEYTTHEGHDQEGFTVFDDWNVFDEDFKDTTGGQFWRSEALY